MKCNFECPFYYRYEYHSAYGCPIYFDRCRLHSKEFNEKNPDFETSKSFGSFGYVKVWGQMTEQQRSKFINHIEKYVELLFKEAENEVEFRKKWDSYEQ